jgi:glutamyl-tRNA reductase
VEGVEQFWGWYSGLAVVPTIRDLRHRGEQLRQQETERLLRRLNHLSPEDQQAIDALTRGLLNKLLHAPTVRLREAAGNGRGTTVLDAVRYLFELDAMAQDAGIAPLAADDSVAPEPDTSDTSELQVRS